MKIYKLTVNEVEQPQGMVISSYRSPRRERRVEYYQSLSSAKAKSEAIYNGVKQLSGFIDNLEVDIKEIEVLP